MRRILLITSVLPWPLRRNGGAQRTALLRDALARHAPVDVLAVGDETLSEALKESPKETSPAADASQRVGNLAGCVVIPSTGDGPHVRPAGPLARLRGVVRQYAGRYDPHPAAVEKFDALMHAHRYDLIVSRYLMPAMRCGVDRYPEVRKVLDFDDIDDQTLADQLRTTPWPGLGGAVGSRLVLRSVRRIVREGIRQFDHLFVTSELDRELVRHDRISVLPNIPFAEPDHPIVPLPSNDISHELLFVGDLQFPPNRDGLDRFLEHVWPEVIAQVPAATVSIVGRGLNDTDRAKWSAVRGVNVVGFAADIIPFYERCAFTIVPVYFGGGTKIKVLESLAHGRTVVATPQAMRGYHASNTVRVASTHREFAASCVELLRAPPTRGRMVENAQGWLQGSYSAEVFQRRVDAAVAALPVTS
jgi:glycosyltransferase involved in cell wall biosynthesis